MSRSYRIRVRESLRRVIRASDRVSSQLELLEILPPEQMAELLARELTARGFARQGDRPGERMVREKGGVRVTVELETGTVTVQAESQQEVNLTSEKEGRAYDERGAAREVRAKLSESLKAGLEKDAAHREAELQKQVTDRLEGKLADLKQELDQAVNRATAAALKLKASQMGQIKALTEDPASGSLTIVVEV